MNFALTFNDSYNNTSMIIKDINKRLNYYIINKLQFNFRLQIM